jgi:uncharacterized protein YjeT (DUF2065 family)
MKLSKKVTAFFAVAAAFMLLYTGIGFILFPVILKKISVQEPYRHHQ